MLEYTEIAQKPPMLLAQSYFLEARPRGPQHA